MKKSMKNDKVQLGSGGKFFNVKDVCKHDDFHVVRSGVYMYVICNMCGKNMGEIVEPIKPPEKK